VTTGLSAEGTGWYANYFLGKLQGLRDQGITIDEAVSSCGGIIAACCGLLDLNPAEIARNYNSAIIKYRYDFLHSLPKAINIILEEVWEVPDKDEFARSLQGRLTIKAKRLPFGTDDYFSEWGNFAEMQKAIYATSSLPFVSQGFPVQVNGKRYIDGMLGGVKMARKLNTDQKIVFSMTNELGWLRSAGLFLHGFVFDRHLAEDLFAAGVESVSTPHFLEP
jgi:hypothetical protein